ncbi:hypothetical protein KH5_15580 [Urechidicola sp. KH5]
MKRECILIVLSFVICFIVKSCSKNTVQTQTKPNIILIVSDDQGISDTGFSGSRDIQTPNIDRIASDGIAFSQGYVTHSYCSPSRAGIMTGRYQQRFGHENNPPYEPKNTQIGLPLNETLISNVLQENGYKTGAVGKWHLGYTKDHLPLQRGFDYWYGFSGGARSYWSLDNKDETPNQRTLFENETPVAENKINYLTNDLTEKALDFIKQSKDNPFFLYLAYNAPHTPLHATKEQLDKTRYLERGERSVYAAMIGAMDEGIGKINSLLSHLNIKDNTLVIFISDNGGVTADFANNTPYRGYKGMLFEGGIRVPFCASWPQVLPAKKVYSKMVSSLDIFPTILAATNIETDLRFDGKNLLPYLINNNASAPHQELYWRTAGGESYAIRKNNYKLTKRMYSDDMLLFDIENDPMEIINLATQNPELVKKMNESYKAWELNMIKPLWTKDGHRPKTKERLDMYNSIREKASNYIIKNE